REVGERDEVALLARVGDPVVIREERDRECADVEREAREMPASRHVCNAQRHAARVYRFRQLEWPHDPRHEIRRHRDRFPETNADVAVGQRLATELRSVRKREQTVSDDERDRERRLELRLVEARKGGARVRRLELRRGEYLTGAGLVDVRAAVE